MSEMINNREYRQKVLKELILELHSGKTVEEIKPRFEQLIQGVSAKEISEMENGLIREGMPVENIQKLCDVHAAVFKGSIEEIHRPIKPEEIPGHPIYILRQENKVLEGLANKQIKPLLEELHHNSTADTAGLKKLWDELWEIDKHYSKKENLLFPYMEKYNITAPPKVMWGVDDEIRAMIKEVRMQLMVPSVEKSDLLKAAEEAVIKINEMIFKEENILFPMVLDTLSEDEWLQISQSSDEIGYCLIKPSGRYRPMKENVESKLKEEGKESSNNGFIHFDAGVLLPEEINAMLNTLPLDITFVDKDGAVKYFSMGKERIFARPKTIIGRLVQNCHPPASVHIVEKIVEDFKNGSKEHEDFWITMGEKFVYIRYFAVRSSSGEYLGTLEVTQDIKTIREISGEKRLMTE